MGLPAYKNDPYLDWSDEKNVEAMRAPLGVNPSNSS
jgi:hypothetical protein